MLLKRTQSNVSTYVPPTKKRKFTGGYRSKKRLLRYTGPQSFKGTGPELKFWDHGADLTALNVAPTVSNPAYYQIASLNLMAAGDDGDQRTGQKIQLKKLNLRMKVAVDPNSNASNANIIANAHTFRVVVYLDMVPSGATPTWDQVFEVHPNNQSQEYVYNKLSSTGRFRVLIDKWIRVPPCYVSYDGTNFHSYGNNMFFKKTVPLDVATRFSDQYNNQTSLQENNIGMFIVSDASATSYTNMKFSYRSRVRFHDY